MPRVCTVCSHQERPAIEQALVDGVPLRRVSKRFGTSTAAVQRHKTDHLPKALVTARAVVEQARDVDEARQALDVVTQLRAVNGVTLAILREAREAKAHGLALQAIARVEKQIELQARLLGELDDRPVVNVLVAPEWLLVRGALLQALQGHPEARQAVASALARLEAG